jgi:putative copper resistance protein D
MSVIVVPRLRAAKFSEGDAFPTVLDGMALSVGVVAGFLLALAIVTRTLLQYSDSHEGDPALSLSSFLFETTVGRGLAFSTLCGGVVAFASAMARQWRSSGLWRGLQIAAVVAFVHFWSSSGHTAASIVGIAPNIVLMVHVLAAGMWVGMLAVIFVTVLPVALRDTARVPLLRATILSFSGVALLSAATTVLTGVLNARTLVGDFFSLPASLYGRTLLLKLAAVAVLLSIGAYNWRVVRPRLHSVAEALRLRSTIRMELLLAAVVLTITAVLVVTMPPA